MPIPPEKNPRLLHSEVALLHFREPLLRRLSFVTHSLLGHSFGLREFRLDKVYPTEWGAGPELRSVVDCELKDS